LQPEQHRQHAFVRYQDKPVPTPDHGVALGWRLLKNVNRFSYLTARKPSGCERGFQDFLDAWEITIPFFRIVE